MRALILHPDCAAGPVASVEAEIEPTADGCRAQFRLQGDITRVIIPPHANAARTDNLWKTTCFEIFWQPHGTAAYHEVNMSPSSRWAYYDFDDVRMNGRDGSVASVSIACNYDKEELFLKTRIACDLPVPANVALSAIVEDDQGEIQFWALNFGDGPADFHSPACRTVHLAGRL